jgi:hypothetical protein
MVIEMDFDLDHNHFFVVLFGSKAPLKIFPRICMDDEGFCPSNLSMALVIRRPARKWN